MQFSEHVFYRYRDGKIDEAWSVIDKAAVVRQLEPPAAAPGAAATSTGTAKSGGAAPPSSAARGNHGVGRSGGVASPAIAGQSAQRGRGPPGPGIPRQGRA